MDNKGKKQLCVGVVGSGAIAQKRHIAELYANPNVEKIVLAAIDEKRATELAQKYNILKLYLGEKSYKELAEDKEVDAVIICTPHVLHAEQSIYCLEHGKHVLVEKPMATNLSDAQRMMDAAEKNKRVLIVGHHRRLQNCYRQAKAILDSSLLGKPRTVRALLKQPGPIEWAPGSTWFFNEPEKGGGVLLDLGIHMADTVLWLLDDSPVRCCSAVNDVCTFYESAFSLVTLKSGVNVCIDVSWGTFAEEKGVKIYCDKGIVCVDEYSEHPVALTMWEPLKSKASFSVQEHLMNVENEPHLGVVDHFINGILENIDTKQSVKYSYDALKVVLASWKSNVEKKVIELFD